MTMTRISTLLLALALAGCATATPCPEAPASPTAPALTVSANPSGPTAADAKAFAAATNLRLRELFARVETSGYIAATYITHDTERAAASAESDLMAFLSEAIPKAASFRDLDLDPDTRRTLELLRTKPTLPAPADPALRDELATISSRLGSHYGAAKYCGPDGKGECRELGELSDVIFAGKGWDAMVDAWVGWHGTAAETRADYQRLVALGNQGARELGFADLGVLWRSGYAMPADDFAAEIDRLWLQVKPLYDNLHCYVRRQLSKKWGADKVPLDGPIPSHLLGNMWAQDWGALYPLVAPYKTATTMDVTKALERKKVDAKQLVKYGEGFFTSLGMPALPDTFYERSQFTKPVGRDVVCHASAWDTDHKGDVRIKMCIQGTEDDFVTAHHELGHVYYYLAYDRLPELYAEGANDGFHEAIGDAVALSVTPSYLVDVGLFKKAPSDERAVLNEQMRRALEKVAFLPFGRLIDQWRWDVFSGKTPPSEYNAAWWRLKHDIQGVVPPVQRTEADFDPGAKYHIPGNTPYMRYFLAAILQFQFHRALCKAAGHTGPLYTCSIYNNKEAGKRFWALLQMGASRPWQDALEALTGERQMDATAILDYFAPLSAWLDEQNKGQQCGW